MDDETIHVSVKNEIDEQLQQRLFGAGSNGRGFALDVAKSVEGDKPTVRFEVAQIKPVHDEWEPPAGLRCPSVEDVESIVGYAKKYGTPANSNIFYNDNKVVLTLNDQVEKGQRERVELDWKFSREWIGWSQLVNSQNAPTHKELLTFLITNQHTVQDSSIIDRMRQVKATAEVSLDSDLRLDAETAGVVFKATAGEALVKFPRQFTLNLPVLDIHTDNPDFWSVVDIRLEVVMPTEPKQPVRFALFASTWNAVRRSVINNEIQTLIAALPEWLIVRGVNKDVPRKLG